MSKQEEETSVELKQESYSWLEIPDDSLDEVVRYSLDEIRLI